MDHLHHLLNHRLINHLIITSSSNLISSRRHNSNNSSNKSIIQVHPKDTSVVYAISLDIGYNSVLRRMIKIIIINIINNNKNSSNNGTTLTVMIISRIIKGWVGLIMMVLVGCNIVILIITWRVHHSISCSSHHVNIMMNVVMNIHHLHNTIMMNVHHLLIVHRRDVANIMNVSITNNIISAMNLLIMSNVSTTSNISVMNLIITSNASTTNNVSISTNANSTIMNVNNNSSSSSHHLRDMFVVFVIFLDIGLNFVLRVVVITMEVD